MKRTLKLLVLLVLISGGQAMAQQDPQFTQYMDNTLFVNPAYAGSRGMLNATAIHREQWVGIPGRPRSTTFSIHSPLVYQNLGLGLTVVNDVVGPINQTMLYGDVSYTINFKNSPGKLSFGVKGGINILNSRTDQLSTTQSDDPNLLTNVRNRIIPNFGVGIYYHTPSWFVGVSTPKILEQAYHEGSSAMEKRHYFLIAGGVFNLTKNERWKLRPTTQLKMTPGAPLSIDISAAAIYKQKLWLGLTYRWADSFGAFIQYQITNQFKAGIAYDQTVTELVGHNKGTYEIMLSYDFLFKKKGLRSPRYF